MLPDVHWGQGGSAPCREGLPQVVQQRGSMGQSALSVHTEAREAGALGLQLGICDERSVSIHSGELWDGGLELVTNVLPPLWLCDQLVNS